MCDIDLFCAVICGTELGDNEMCDIELGGTNMCGAKVGNVEVCDIRFRVPLSIELDNPVFNIPRRLLSAFLKSLVVSGVSNLSQSLVQMSDVV